jgi:cbb3-type cytochrome oxidase subunit 3
MDLDINDVRGLMTAVMLVTFVGIFLWTWMGRRDRFHDAAMLPFDTTDEQNDAGQGDEPR